MVLHDRGVIFMGYGGADLGILKLLNELPREALPFGAYWVHPHEPYGPVREWLSNRQGVWVRSGWFDEVMLLIRNEFALPHPSGERFTRIFQEYHQKFQELSDSIQKKSPAEAGIQALKKALTDTEALFPDFWKVISEARRLERRDPLRAEEVYRQGAIQFPNDAPLLGSYALFLSDIRKDYDAAEAMHKRALEADPKQAITLGNYALFLKNVRKDYDDAETMYKRALETDPQRAITLGNYALFLSDIRKDYDAAEAMYKRALEVDPKDANNLGNYANFLNNIRKDYDDAEAMYKRALEVDPQRAITLGNYASFLLANGNADGLALLDRALQSLRENPLPQVELECAFYLFAHGPSPNRADALRLVRKLVEHGVRSPGWNLSRNIDRAGLDGHSESFWLPKLAAVVNDDAQPDLLSNWPAWQSAAA